MRDVNFSYPTRPEAAVMDGMTVSVRAGQSTALVGPSGYGKSTVMALLERFYDPQTGSIQMDGTELHKVRRNLSVVIFSLASQFKDYTSLE